jgi:thiol-disulfide isomerase/thioredoxin
MARRGITLVAVAALSAACAGPAAAPAATRGATASPSAPAPSSPSGSSPVASPSTPSPTPAPWATTAMTDVRTNQELNLADLAGKTVLLEGMATWCPPCLEQQSQAALALGRLDPTRVVYISLDIDPREEASTLAAYATKHTFGWMFAVGKPGLLRQLAEAFGDGILSPPSTPILVIAPDGTAKLSPFGIKTAPELVELATAAA